MGGPTSWGERPAVWRPAGGLFTAIIIKPPPSKKRAEINPLTRARGRVGIAAWRPKPTHKAEEPAMKHLLLTPAVFSFLFTIGMAHVARAEERTERFDKDPGWDARNNRAAD